MGMKRKKRSPDDDHLIQSLSVLVEAIAKSFGSHCEVVLHDLRQLDKSVVKIEHGHVTGRKVGSSVTDLALRSFKEIKDNMTGDILLNYRTTTKNGKILKSTTALVRNRANEPIAALCINIDTTHLQALSSVLNELCHTNEEQAEIKETFEKDMNTTIGTIVNKVISTYGTPVRAMQKEDRLKIVASLDEQGVFLVKGAVKLVARGLNVSKYAIYNYLEKVRSGEATP
jgi:predicted transcriptional regulator YheO